MILVRKTQSGGREIIVNSPWLKARVVDGVAVEWEPRTPAEPRSRDCIHMGGLSRSVQCGSCNGKVMVKLHACAIHGECEPRSTRVDGVRSCRTCEDYRNDRNVEISESARSTHDT